MGLGAIIGLALPLAAYFWFIESYSTNVIYWDQWNDVSLLGDSYSGTLSLGSLWQQYGDHRMLFPRLIVLELAHTTSFNIVFEEFLSGVMLALATGLIIWSHKRRSPSTPWLYYAPVALLLLSFVQYQDTLWGFQMAWYLVLLALGATLFLLDRMHLSGLAVAGAVACAVVGSYSSLQGLLIWPAGLVLLLLRHRSRRIIIGWIGAALVTVAGYFFHFSSSSTQHATGGTVSVWVSARARSDSIKTG